VTGYIPKDEVSQEIFLLSTSVLGPCSLLAVVSGHYLPRIKRSEREADHLLPSKVEI
jgi:hypothetical protein